MSAYFDNKELYVGPNVNQYGSHMIMTDVQRDIKTKYINVDTKFRDEYSDNFNVNYNITLSEKYNNVRSISVTNLELPMTFYLISESFENNTFKITDNGSSNEGVVTLEDGNYDEASLKSAINAKIGALGAPFSNLTFDISYNKSYFMNGSGANTFTLNFDVDKNGDFAKYGMKSRLGWLIGYRAQSVVIFENATLRATALVNLNLPRYLFLCVNEMNSIGNQNRNKLARISLDQVNYPFGTVMPASHDNYLTSDVRKYSKLNDLQKINVQLVNDSDKVVNLNGQDISFYLKIEYE